MAEAWANALYPRLVEAQSAGLEPGSINPHVVQAMAEVRIDISQKSTTAVDYLIQTGLCFDYVITVCDESSAETCPTFPGPSTRLHWSFPDPSKLTGSDEVIMRGVRKIRDSIKEKVLQFGEELGSE